MNDAADPSSSDHSLRYRAPSCVAMRWRGTETYVEADAERLSRRFTFAETALRYVAGALAADHASHGGNAGSWETLRGSLGAKPVALGLWGDAARDLSLAAVAAPAPMLPGVAAVLARLGPTGRPELTPAWAALERLVQLRNLAYHDDVIAPGTSRQYLAESEGPFRQFLAALRTIGRHAPWVVLRSEQPPGAQRRYLVMCLRGLDAPPPRWITPAGNLTDGTPFVVSTSGAVLYLAPFLQWQDFAPGRGPELRLFKGWKRGPLFSDPRGECRAVVLPGAEADAPTWSATALTGTRHEGVFTPNSTDLPVLLDPERADAPPVVPGFTLGVCLGHGGNGRVYLARRKEPDQQVAVKVLTPSLVVDHAARARLKREYEAMRRIHHPNVATVYEYLPDSQAGPTLVMEYVLGSTLRQCVDRRTFSLPAALALIEQVLAGLDQAHALGIVHRDVTPENVIVTPEGQAKLLDFGIARVAGDEGVTRTVDGLGKLNFAAPEQLARPQEAGPPADVFATARLLGYLVSGSSLAADQLASLPPALQAIVRKATDADPTRRHPNARALLAALTEAKSSGWSGAPISEGERLSGTIHVVAAVRDVGDGLWWVTVRDDEGADHAAVVAERRAPAELALATRLKALSPATRDTLRHPELQESREGVKWCVLRFQPANEAVSLFLGLAPAPTPPAAPTPRTAPSPRAAPIAAPTPPAASPAPTAVAVPPASDAPWTPPGQPLVKEPPGAGLVGLFVLCFFCPPLLVLLYRALSKYNGNFLLKPEPTGKVPPYLPAAVRDDAPKQIAARLDHLACLVVVQRQARGAEALDAATWHRLRRQPLLAAWGVLALPATAHLPEHAAQLPPAGALSRAQGGVLALRRLLVAGQSRNNKRTLRGLVLAERLLRQLVHAGAVPTDPQRLGPFLRLEAGRWVLLDERRA